MLDPAEIYEVDDDVAAELDEQLAAAGTGPVLVHAVRGFVDAGHAGDIAAEHLVDELPARRLATFDVDQLLDYRSRRPMMTFDATTWREYEEPELVVDLVDDAQGTSFLLLHGTEPDVQWERYVAAVRQLVERFSVPLTVGVNGVPMGVPHTRPTTLTAHATRPELVADFPSWFGTVRVPASAQTLLELRLGQSGHDAMGFVVHVPHYLAQSTYPQAAIAALHRLERVSRILDVAVSQMAALETMTPLDFLDFRDLLRPASGFQSIQFKMIEATLGLAYEHRHAKNYYLTQLNKDDIERVKKAEREESLLVLINRWLERMPFIKDSSYWHEAENDGFWVTYRKAYEESLQEAERGNLETFDLLFMNDAGYPENRRLSPDANRNALFIMLYRDNPMLHLPYELLDTLLEIDELLSMWRHRHIHMVQRTIGKRVGTGGSSGADYLRTAADSHYVFKELAELTSFLLPRHLLPKLPQALTQSLGYH